LSHSDAFNGVVPPRSELSSVDIRNSAKQPDSLLQLCELETVNVTHSSAVTLHPPAEVSYSSLQSSNVCDSDAQPAVVNPPVPLISSELMSDVDRRLSSDIARDWSAGVLVTDSSGKSVEVITMLFHYWVGVCCCVTVF